MVYGYYVEGLACGINEHLTVEVRTSLGIDEPVIQIRNIDPAWTSLLGVTRQIRHEVTHLFWRSNTFRLWPRAISRLNALACREIRRVFLEVVHPDRGASSYAFNVTQLLEAMPQLLRFSSLEVVDVCIDAPCLRDCIPIDREGYCEEHKKLISDSKILTKLANSLNENYAGYLHFRFHLNDEAMLRTHETVVSKFPSLREKGNNSLRPCDNHLLGQCEYITCRLLHAIEEMCQNKWARPAMRLYFFEESISSWNEDTSIWRSQGELPLVVNLMDMKRGVSEDRQRLKSDGDLFDVLYLSATASGGSTRSTEDH